MPRRAASVTQADIARAIRAMKAEGCPAVRVVMRDGGVIVEPAEADVERQRVHGLAERARVVVL